MVATFVKKDALRRIIRDIKEIRDNPLTSHGIYYEHDETDVLKGRALIIGPADTPYADGFYLFKFQFPTNYPHAPPKVEFCTSDGQTRFNPNLYRSGKVCLSILNTWNGEPWSGCQTISSVLLAMCTILNDEPLLNEPGVTKTHRDYDAYNEIIRYKNIEVAIFGMLASVSEASVSVCATKDNEPGVITTSISVINSISASNSISAGTSISAITSISASTSMSEFAIFGPIMREYFLANKEKIRERTQALAGRQALASAGRQALASAGAQASAGSQAGKVIEYNISVYKMTVLADYKKLLEKF
jgi:ubiquitin-protein ligase